ncbi:Ku protein [Burkholderia sp. Bp9031]|uniref:non-homologous end joining protein Ku n=1 Tax=Burkholderia sp. Bp9031 TaxID=2184566 RepID=UPI000F5F206B|nr:Ku protein [Burkholderia sp. Bp9031]RQZ16601.1 Ku protein [Burkholderia sp. Bp9031]
MAPRMIWKGAISFGLVHVPVQLFPATRTVKPSFRLLDKRSMDPVGYRQINKRTGKEVTREDIVRGYEYEKERYVVLTDEEIRAANPESTQTVDILTFVDEDAVSFLYLDTPYYLVPDRKGEKVYALLRDALKDSGKIGIALVVMRDRQHLGALIPVGPLLALDTLRWQEELRPLDELSVPADDAKRAGVTARELGMAKKLIDDMSGKWAPDEYHDTFRDDILELVERKVRAGKIEEIEERPPQTGRAAANVVDLTELLKRSLKGGGGAHAADLRDADDESDVDADASSSPSRGGGRRKPAAKGASKAASKGATTKAAAKRPAAKRAATGAHAEKKTAARRKHAA